jgi:hypothetical protein
MKTLDLSTQTDIQLELLLVREEKMAKAISNILIEIDKVCMEEMDMNLEQLLEANDWSIDRLKSLRSEMEHRASKV